MSKKKAQERIELKDWNQADGALREAGLAQILLERIEGDLARRMAELKTRAEEQAAPHQERLAALEEALERFWLARRGDVAPAKSRLLTFGALGTRASRAVRYLRGWTAEKVIGALGHGFAQFLRVEHSVDKSAILKAPPEQLAELRRCGVAIEERERFFAEPDRATLAAPPLPWRCGDRNPHSAIRTPQSAI